MVNKSYLAFSLGSSIFAKNIGVHFKFCIKGAVALRKKKKKVEEKKSGSWFSGFWGSSKKSKKEEDKSGKAFILRSLFKYHRVLNLMPTRINNLNENIFTVI